MMIRSLMVIVFVVALLLALGSALSSPVLADANGKASCVGIESSAISPPGSSDEEPGGRAQLAHEIKNLAGEFGAPPGAIISDFAQTHAGSHENCDQPAP